MYLYIVMSSDLCKLLRLEGKIVDHLSREERSNMFFQGIAKQNAFSPSHIYLEAFSESGNKIIDRRRRRKGRDVEEFIVQYGMYCTQTRSVHKRIVASSDTNFSQNVWHYDVLCPGRVPIAIRIYNGCGSLRHCRHRHHRVVVVVWLDI